jgi:predicted CXXCH cytochrome family protein
MYSLTTDVCATCHATHTAQGPMLLNRPSPQSELCFTCHDGSPASNIKAQYADPTVPANNPGTGSYFSHTATELTGPACAECHQPHLADGTPAVETTNGWTASGAIFGASGVSVVNGAAGDPPAYAMAKTSTFEYQLCFKCHSGYADLPDPTGPPSTWMLDKAVELNPANNSYHPIEAPGKNQTAQLDVSLSGDPTWGTSPYKLWNFTTDSTIRCVSCHGDSRLGNPASPPDPGDRLAPHAVANRGILIENLRNRVLKGSSDAYQAADFALCYVCHAEAPFVDTSQDPLIDTNFPLHGTHTAGIATFFGPGGTVDDDGAGHGNAICAECHFRTHGTTYAVDNQPAWSRLVNFAPNVQPYQGSNPVYAGRFEWDDASNTCTLTCHGVDHGAWSY